MMAATTTTMATRQHAAGRRHGSAAGLHQVTSAAAVLLAALLAAATAPTPATAERHVTAAAHHLCVVTPGDAVQCSGDEFLGASSKTTVPAGIPFMAVTAGDAFTCGLATNGTTVCWGEFPGATPSLIDKFIDIHAGANNVCGLTKVGIVRCYGNATAGVNTVPTGPYQGVSTGTDVACGVKRDHTIACWGDGTNPVISALPPSITDADHVSVGLNHACYVTTTGTLTCWGDNTFGQAAVPADVNTASAVWWLSAGGRSTCVISGSSADNMVPPGQLTCWGESTGDLTGMSAYEVACSAWGCIVSEDAGNGAAKTSFAATSLAGVPIPRAYAMAHWVGGTRGSVDGVGTNAQLDSPSCLNLHADTLIVSDPSAQLIRCINTTTAELTTLAGRLNIAGHADSNDPHTATFMGPYGVGYGAGGNMYVDDTGTYLLRQISPAGVVTTIAGRNGVSTPATDGAGTDAILGYINDMRYDAANDILFFTDYDNAQVRALYSNLTVGTIATVGYNLNCLVFDSMAHLLVVGGDFGVFKVTYEGASWLFVGDTSTPGYVDGPALDARFYILAAMDRDPAGNLYVTDSNNFAVRKISSAGDVVTLFGSVSGNAAGVGTNAQLGYPWGLRLEPAGAAVYVVDIMAFQVWRTEIVYTLPPAPVAIGAAPTTSGYRSGDQLTSWRVLAANPTRVAIAGVVNATTASPLATLNAANTAGMNPSIRTLLLGFTMLSGQTGAGPADVHTFSTSARRGLHTLALVVDTLPPYALALPRLETLNVGSVAGTLEIAAHSFAGLDALNCINCDGAVGLANLSGLGVRSSATPGNLSLLSASDLLSIADLDTLDLTANDLTSIEEHDFDGAPYLTDLYIGNNPGLTFIHCAAFTLAQQPQLRPGDIDETGNPPSTWRAGCPSSTPTPTPTASITPSGSGTPSHTPSGSATPSHTPSGSGTPSVTPSVSGTPSHTPSGSGTPSYTPSGSGTPSNTATPSITATPTTTLLPVGAASSGAYKPDMFAAALALGLLSVAFILALLFCRNVLCCRCCCCGAGGGRRAQAPPPPPPPAPVKGGDRRIVLNLAGAEDSAATAAAKVAVDASITVNSAGGGFVLYGGV